MNGACAGRGRAIDRPLPIGRAARSRADAQGFTLIEIMIALGILGTALFVLLHAQYVTLHLCVDVQEEVIMRNLLEQALAQAEIEVLAGNGVGVGEFGKRYPDYAYSFEAVHMGEDETVRLYEVIVKVEGPIETRTMSIFVYDKAQPW